MPCVEMKWKHHAAMPTQTRMNNLMGIALAEGSLLVNSPTRTMNRLKASRYGML